MGLNWKRISITAIILILLITAGYYLLHKPRTMEDPVVISMTTRNVTLSQAVQAYAALPPQLKLRISLTDFIQNVYPRKLVLLQAAEDAGYTLPVENASQVAAQIDLQFKAENSSLDEYLQGLGLTRDAFIHALAEDMLIQAYMRDILTQVNVTVTENETRALYEQLNLSRQNLTYENVSSRLTELIKQQKEQDYLNQYIAFLMMKYNVTINTDALTAFQAKPE